MDDREKRPLPFPAFLPLGGGRNRTVQLLVRTTRLRFGDYCLESHPTHAIIERKASLDEIATNCLNPHRKANFEKELLYLRENVPHPLLLFEGDPHSLLRATTRNPSPFEAVDAFQRLLLIHRIPALFLPANSIPQLRSIAEWAARWLINASLIPQGESPCPVSPSSPPMEPPTSTPPAPSAAAGSCSPLA